MSIRSLGERRRALNRGYKVRECCCHCIVGGERHLSRQEIDVDGGGGGCWVKGFDWKNRKTENWRAQVRVEQ